jgi:hypothetical protein
MHDAMRMILALCLAGETDRADPQLQVIYVVFEAPGKSTRTASVEHDRHDVPCAWIFSFVSSKYLSETPRPVL